jgi:hypothetical protein
MSGIQTQNFNCDIDIDYTGSWRPRRPPLHLFPKISKLFGLPGSHHLVLNVPDEGFSVFDLFNKLFMLTQTIKIRLHALLNTKS